MKNGFKIVDADLHVIEPHDLYLKYMDPKWGDRIPRAQPRQLKAGQIHDFRTADGSHVRHPWREAPKVEMRSLIRMPHRAEKIAPDYEEAVARQFDSVSELHAMDREGLDVGVLFRTNPLIADESQGPEYAIAICRAWNDWITDFAKENPQRLKAAGLITLHDVNLAIAESRRVVKELGHVGLCMIPQPINGHNMQDEYFDPLWTEIEELGVPVCFHPTAGNNQPCAENVFLGHKPKMLLGVFGQPLGNLMGMAEFIVGGILERHPRLKVGFLEGNCSWVPWLLYRLDEYWELLGKDEEVKLSLKPSEYFHRQCFVHIDVDEAPAADVIRRLGADNLFFSSDYPHADSRFPHATETFLALEGIDEASKRKILWDNPARMYNLR
jgi:predicted TIM-barrel fold metal-dependent hydrolase